MLSFLLVTFGLISSFLLNFSFALTWNVFSWDTLSWSIFSWSLTGLDTGFIDWTIIEYPSEWQTLTWETRDFAFATPFPNSTFVLEVSDIITKEWTVSSTWQIVTAVSGEVLQEIVPVYVNLFFNDIKVSRSKPFAIDIDTKWPVIKSVNWDLLDDAIINVETNEPAICRRDDEDVDYEDMWDSFWRNFATGHETTIDIDVWEVSIFVHCKDQFGNISADPWTLNLITNLDKATIKYPTDQQQINGGPINFSWEYESNYWKVAKYKIDISNDDDFATKLVSTSVGTSTVFNTTINATGSYYRQITAFDTTNNTSVSETTQFYVNDYFWQANYDMLEATYPWPETMQPYQYIPIVVKIKKWDNLFNWFDGTIGISITHNDNTKSADYNLKDWRFYTFEEEDWGAKFLGKWLQIMSEGTHTIKIYDNAYPSIQDSIEVTIEQKERLKIPHYYGAATNTLIASQPFYIPLAFDNQQIELPEDWDLIMNGVVEGKTDTVDFGDLVQIRTTSANKKDETVYTPILIDWDLYYFAHSTQTEDNLVKKSLFTDSIQLETYLIQKLVLLVWDMFSDVKKDPDQEYIDFKNNFADQIASKKWQYDALFTWTNHPYYKNKAQFMVTVLEFLYTYVSWYDDTTYEQYIPELWLTIWMDNNRDFDVISDTLYVYDASKNEPYAVITKETTDESYIRFRQALKYRLSRDRWRKFIDDKMLYNYSIRELTIKWYKSLLIIKVYKEWRKFYQAKEQIIFKENADNNEYFVFSTKKWQHSYQNDVLWTILPKLQFWSQN